MKAKTKIKRLLFWSAGFILVALLIVRILLPSWVEDFVNRSIDELESYEGQIADVDLALWRGAYTIKGIAIHKADTSEDLPFFEAEQIDVSLEWKALLKGAVVGELHFVRPILRFVQDDEEPQLGDEGGWARALQSLVPIELNRVEVVDGMVSYRGRRELALPDLVVEKFHLLAQDITNEKSDERELPATIEASGSVMSGAELTVRGRFDLLAEEPAMDASLTCETIDLVELNELLRRKAAIDVKSGQLDVYSEWALMDSKLDGYLKLIAEDVEIFDLQEDAGNPLEIIWQGLAGILVQTTKNQSRDQFATKVPFKGDLENLDTGVMASIVSTLENAFVQAMQRDLDGTIKLSDASGSESE